MPEDEHVFTITEALALMPKVRARGEEVVRLRATLAELTHDLRVHGRSELGGVAEAKACEARLGEHLTWFTEKGIEVKSIAPLLIDFPARLEGRSVRLCWLEGERDLEWYHRSELGFAGRRRLPH
ncbi:DUF2203 domain-containing protein [Rhizohabitans arisaemae]|uniref:DUF2203 domain-containing protein n=1 Tax=Rhizohabitans arisaemae TaxID=2720610 RepID=UPI0024B0F6EC|nr:DUF2203 domain-containing protein [Rhizohabitans arisaemae]